jgi:glycosyltransferase involved in cell wall biosynthesis
MAQPTVSLLVAMRNEAAYINRCLGSLFRQDYPSDKLEILVLDGMSTDGSRELVQRAFRSRENCRLLDNHGISQAQAWNLGIKESTGEILGIISGHCELAEDYVSQAVETLIRTGADLVGGPMRAISEQKIGSAIACATSVPFGVGNARFHYLTREDEVDTVYMGVCWKKVYERIGGFDVGMACNEDDELSYRLLASGGRIVCNPAIRSHYYNRMSFQSLWHQYYRYGFWKVKVMQKHLAQMRLRHFAPASLVSTMAAAPILGIFRPRWMIVVLLIVLLYLAANLVVSIITGYRTRFRYIHLVALAFMTLHMSYGLGFLRGLISFLVFPLRLAEGRKSPE